MSWTTYFNQNPDPSAFDPSVDIETLNGYQASQVDSFLSSVISKLNEEARRMNSGLVYDLNQVKGLSPQNWDSLTNVDKFNLVVANGETILTQVKNSTLTTTAISDFYQKYYFRQPTATELEALSVNPYGLGESTQKELKTQAISYLDSYGIVDKSNYEGLSQDQQIAKLDTYLSRPSDIRATATYINNDLIDADKVELDPYGSISALIQLKDSGAATINSSSKYSFVDDNGIDQLAEIDSGKWLTTYQSLEKKWRESGTTQTLSEYLASQQAFRAENERITLSPTSDYEVELSGTLDKILADQIAANIGSPEEKLAEIQTKIDKLKEDAFTKSYNQLKLYQTQEEQQGSVDDLFGEDSLQSFAEEMAADLGVKSDFFKIGDLNSSVTYDWQKWFDTELAKRYDTEENPSYVKSILGSDLSDEDIDIARGFIDSFLRERFDGSKALSEFNSYIEPGQGNVVLEESAVDAWSKYSDDNYYSLLGNLTDPNSNLGNFWTLLKSGWASGLGFSSQYYKDQEVIDSNQQTVTIEKLWDGLKAIHAVALEKNTTDLKASDFDESIYTTLGIETEEQLTNKINEYRAWWNRAFEYGSDLNNLDEFTSMHYNVYKQELVSSSLSKLVVVPDGKVLNINTPDAFEEADRLKIQQMAESLAYEASNYISRIQYGEFTPPEEYVKDLLNNASIFSMFSGTALDDTSALDIIKEFTDDFVGTISTYAGEQIRNSIRALIDEGTFPSQEELGVDYIERSKEQALSTIRNIIRKDAETTAVNALNIKAPLPGQSLSEWFRNLGLEIIPGDTWTKFKSEHGISDSLSFEDWEKYYSYQSNGSGGVLGEDFWKQWSADNQVTMSVVNDRVSFFVASPSSAWKTWGNNIVNSISKNDSSIINALDGASVEVKEGELNKSWYSSTNAYTKVLDDWKKVKINSTDELIDIDNNEAWKWAKESNMDPTETWNEYVTEKQKTNRSFGKDAAGDTMTYDEWAADAKSYDIDEFWKSTNSHWVQYLIDKRIAKPDSTDTDLKIKTWEEWAADNNIVISDSTNDYDKNYIPNAFLDLHYSVLGGKAKVDEEYLSIYFPEFELLASDDSSDFSENFDLTEWGFDSNDMSIESMLEDFDSYDPFKAIDSDFGFDSEFSSSSSSSSPLVSVDTSFGVNVTTTSKSKTNSQYTLNFDLGFDSAFGDFDFGW